LFLEQNGNLQAKNPVNVGETGKLLNIPNLWKIRLLEMSY
jgi:hypothetical protein